MTGRSTRNTRATSNRNDAAAAQQQVHPSTIENTLTHLKHKTDALSKQASDHTKQQKEITSSQQFLSSQYDEIMAKFNEISECNKEMRSELNAVTKKCRDQSIEISQLKSKLNAYEQEKINKNALIRGISMEDDAKNSVIKIAELAGITVNVDEIASARHIQNNNKQPSIVVSFKCTEKKSEFVKSAKQHRISSAQFGYSGDAYPIFVDHQLTTESFNIFREAKKLKQIGVSFVWIANGNILLREKPNAPITKITSLSQIKEIEKELLLRSKKRRTANLRTTTLTYGKSRLITRRPAAT